MYKKHIYIYIYIYIYLCMLCLVVPLGNGVVVVPGSAARYKRRCCGSGRAIVVVSPMAGGLPAATGGGT